MLGRLSFFLSEQIYSLSDLILLRVYVIIFPWLFPEWQTQLEASWTCTMFFTCPAGVTLCISFLPHLLRVCPARTVNLLKKDSFGHLSDMTGSVLPTKHPLRVCIRFHRRFFSSVLQVRGLRVGGINIQAYTVCSVMCSHRSQRMQEG